MKRAFTLILILVLALTMPLTVRAEDDFGTGVTVDNTYWNEALEIGCTLDESWYFYTREEILQANGETAQMLEGEIAQMVKEGGSLMDMFAVNLETGATVNVIFERLSLANSLMLSEESYLELTKPTLQEAFEQLDIEDIEMEILSVEFMGKERQALCIAGSYDGTPVLETQVVMKSGRNVTVVTVFSLDEEEIGEVLAAFFDSVD